MIIRFGTTCIVFFTFLASTLYGFNWPVSEPVITSTFGSPEKGNFGNGIAVMGSSDEVRPSEDGELIFYYDSDSPAASAGSLGNYAVIEHERKLRTVYSNISLAGGIKDLKKVKTSDSLGQTFVGNRSAGLADSSVLYFAVIDNEFEQFVNPVLLLDSIVDNKFPVVNEIGIRSQDGYRAIGSRTEAAPGTVELLADIYDPCMDELVNNKMAPFKIYLFLNGEQIFNVTFESISFNGDYSFIQSEKKKQFYDFYKIDGMISLGEITLVPGDARFEILVSDYAGNETGMNFQINVVD